MQPVTARLAKPYPKLYAEAASLTTAPARLAVLSHRDAPMGPLALRNPQLPTARLAEALLTGKPAAWDNPAAPFVLWDLPPEKVRAGAVACGLDLARLRKEGKAYPVTDAMRALLRGPMTEAWKKPEAPEKFRRWDRATTTIAMMTYLSEFALWCGALSPIHRQATLVFCLLVRGISHERSAASRAAMAASVESLTWDNAPSGRIGALVDATKGRTVTGYALPSFTDPIGALVMYALVPLTPGWDGGGVGDVWRQTRNGFDAVIRAAMPDPPWLAELA